MKINQECKKDRRKNERKEDMMDERYDRKKRKSSNKQIQRRGRCSEMEQKWRAW
jgi:hypothetical protein